MKKIFLCLMMFAICILPISRNAIKASASSEEITYVTGQENVFGGDSLTTLQTSSTGTYLSVTGENTVLTIKNTVININNPLDNIFSVGSGATLILDNVSFVVNALVGVGINNAGKVILKDANISSSITKSIINNSDGNSLELHKATLHSVDLNNGYITVHDDSQISSVVRVNIGTIDDDVVGKPIVKGVNTSADCYIDKFIVSNTLSRDEYRSATDSDELTNLIDANPYYLDYVGDVGENGPTYNGVKVGAGDLIVTKFKVRVVDNNEGTETYICGDYCTADLYLSVNSVIITANTRYYKNGQLNTGATVLDNMKGLIGANDNGVCLLTEKDEIDSYVNISVNVTESTTSESEGTYTFKMIKGVPHKINVPLTNDYVSSSSATDGVTISSEDLGKFASIVITNPSANSVTINVSTAAPVVEPTVIEKELFLENNSLDFTGESLKENIRIYYTDEDKVYLNSEDFIVKQNGSESEFVNAGEYTVVVTKEIENVEFINKEFTVNINKVAVDAMIEGEYTYTGSDQTSSVKVYYFFNGNKNYLENSQFKIQKSGVDSEFANAGDYSIIITATLDNFTFNSTTLDLTMNKANVDLALEGEYTYTGNNQKENVKISYTFGSKEYLTSSMFVIKQNNIEKDFTNAGEYVVYITGEVDNINFNQSTLDLTMNKVNVDLTLEGEYTYTGNDQKENVKISYTFGSKEYLTSSMFVIKQNNVETNFTDAGDYIVYVTGTLDNINFANTEIAITMQKQVVNTANIVFEDKTVKYDGNNHSLELTGYDGELVEVSYSENNFSRICLEGYEVVATLTLLDANNYKLNTNTFTAKLYILKGDLDTSSFTFGDKEVTYTGNSVEHNITGTLPNGVTVDYEYYQFCNPIHNLPKNAGEYVVIAKFTVDSDLLENYNPIDEISVNLVITKAEIDCEDISFTDKTVTYNEQVHTLDGNNLPIGITAKYYYNETSNIFEGATNAGTYSVEMKLEYDVNNYTLINEDTYVAILTINKADVDMRGIAFTDVSKIYDGCELKREIVGTLPKGIVRVDYEDNTRTNAGVSNAVAKFVVNENYNPVQSKYCRIEIKQKEITVGLVQDRFVYTGSPIVVVPSLSGVVIGDVVNVVLNNASNTDAGDEYFATIHSIDNPNYRVNMQTTLKYVIEKATVDMSGITFADVSREYSGEVFVPTLTGTLPAYLEHHIVYDGGVNVGEYSAYVEFELLNDNYILPSPMSAKVTITPKPVIVNFTNNMSEKFVEVSLSGMLDEDNITCHVTYNKTSVDDKIQITIKVGLVGCNNYAIAGNKEYTFLNTFDGGVDYNEISMEFDSIVSSSDNKFKVSEENPIEVRNALNTLDLKIKGYEIFSVNTIGNNNKQTYTLNLNNTNLNLDRVQLYKLVDDKLEKVEFTIDKGILTFESSEDMQLVLIEEKGSALMIVLIFAISLVVIGAATVTTILLIKKKHNKK